MALVAVLLLSVPPAPPSLAAANTTGRLGTGRRVQLAGGFVAACAVIEGDEDHACQMTGGDPPVELYRSAIRASWWYLFGYSLLLVV